MAMKIVIGSKSGKCYQKELSNQEAESLRGKVLGEEFKGELLDMAGYEFVITGGSDASGFPMRKDINGISRKKILIAKSTGFRGKLRGRRYAGLRVKKNVAGNTVYEKTHQLNLKVKKEGKETLDKIFGVEVQENQETKTE